MKILQITQKKKLYEETNSVGKNEYEVEVVIGRERQIVEWVGIVEREEIEQKGKTCSWKITCHGIKFFFFLRSRSLYPLIPNG